jgi:hypothetical protein
MACVRGSKSLDALRCQLELALSRKKAILNKAKSRGI